MIHSSAVNMRQKLITLCPTSFEEAKKMPNFSAWVRAKLLEKARLDRERIERRQDTPYVPYVIANAPKKVKE